MVLNFLLSHWAVLITGIFAILGLFKINLTVAQKKAITILWNEIDDVIVTFINKDGKKPEAKDIEHILIARSSNNKQLNKIIHKIENTKGHKLLDVVEVLTGNYAIIKKLGVPAWKLIKGFLKIF